METFEEREERERAAVASFAYAKPVVAPPNAQQIAIDQATLDSLEAMSHEELVQLIRRVAGAMWGVGLMTPADIAAAFKLKLATGGLTEKDMFKALPLMREWFDRELGKAAQSIAMTVEDKGLNKLTDEKLLRLESALARMTGQDAIVIAPMPKKLSEDEVDAQHA